MCDVRLNALVYRDLELVGKFAAYKPDLLYIRRAYALTLYRCGAGHHVYRSLTHVSSQPS